MSECCSEMDIAIATDKIERRNYKDSTIAAFYMSSLIVGGRDYETIEFRHCPFCGQKLCSS